MTVSYLRRSRHQLWSDLLVTLGGQEAFLTRRLTEKQMLLEILQIYGSPITSLRVNGFNALLEAVVNAAGGSASHLRQTKSEMLGALVTALGGTPPVVGYSSLTELLAACVNAADTGQGGGGYVAKAVHFDGATSVVMSGPSSLIANSSLVSFSIWTKAHDYLADGRSHSFSIVVDATNYNFNLDMLDINGVLKGLKPQFIASVVDPTQFVGINLDTGYSSDGTSWIWMAGCLDTGHASGAKIGHVLINGVEISTAVADSSSGPFEMQFNGIQWAVPDVNDAPYYSGDVADVWVAPGQFVDFTDPTVRAKFWDGSKPISLGSDGSLPTGIAPAIFLSGDATSFATNRGNGDAFAMAEGTLTNATTSPSD